MLRKLSIFNLVLAVLAPLAFTGDEAHAGGVAAGATRATATNFDPFCIWVNQKISGRSYLVNYQGRDLKVNELLPDGRLRLTGDGEASVYAPFEGAIIDRLLSQIHIT